MNEKERLELASKLDQDLDDFINSLERKPYTDGWSQNSWKEVSNFHSFLYIIYFHNYI